MSSSKWIAIAMSAVALGLASPASADGPNRVAFTVHGPDADGMRTEIEGVLAKHDVEVDSSSEVRDKLTKLDADAAVDDDFIALSRMGGDKALILFTIAENGADRTLVISVYNGKDGALLGRETLNARGAGARPLEIKTQSKLWGELSPMLATAEAAPSDKKKPKERAKTPKQKPVEVDDDGLAAPRPHVARPPARDHVEKPARGSLPVLFLSANLEQDFAFLGGRDDACSPASQQSGVSCFRSSGTQYLGTPMAGQADQASGTPALSTTRLLLGADFLVSQSFTLGLRAGVAVRGGGPTSSSGQRFLPAHFEGRLAYWLSSTAFGSPFSPFLFVAGGVAQMDASAQVDVAEDRSVPPPPSQLDNPKHQTLDVWRKYGAGFGAGGIGAYIPFGDKHGVLADLRGTFLFPSVGGAAALSLGYAFGL